MTLPVKPRKRKSRPRSAQPTPGVRGVVPPEEKARRRMRALSARIRRLRIAWARRDLNPHTRAFSPILCLSTQVGEKSPVRGFHASYASERSLSRVKRTRPTSAFRDPSAQVRRELRTANGVMVNLVPTAYVATGRARDTAGILADDANRSRAARSRFIFHTPRPCAVPKFTHGRWPGVSRPLGRSAVLGDQGVQDLPALDPGGDVDGLAGLPLWGLLLQGPGAADDRCSAERTWSGPCGGAARRGSARGPSTRGAASPRTAPRMRSLVATGPAS
jgi:hypothetical protein